MALLGGSLDEADTSKQAALEKRSKEGSKLMCKTDWSSNIFFAVEVVKRDAGIRQAEGAGEKGSKEG